MRITNTLLALSLALAPAFASTDVAPGNMNLNVFVVLKVAICKAVTEQAQPPAPPAPVPPEGDEQRAIERIRAMAPVLANTNQAIERRLEIIPIIARQGMAGPIARENAIDALGQCLVNTTHAEKVQLAALDACARIGAGSRRAPAIIARVLSTTDNPIPVRVAAVNALGVIARPETLPETLGALERVVQNTSHGEAVQNAAVDALAWIARTAPQAADILSRWLVDTNRPLNTRHRVVQSMLGIEHPESRQVAVAGLTQVLLNTSHAEALQLAAVEAIAFLGRFNSPALNAYARVLSRTENPIPVRLAILRAIAAAPPENACEAVAAAGQVLGNSGHAEQVQNAAVATLAAVGGACADPAVEAMGRALRGTDFARSTRMACLQTIARIGRGNRRAEEIVERVVNDGSHADEVRKLAQQVLAELYR